MQLVHAVTYTAVREGCDVTLIHSHFIYTHTLPQTVAGLSKEAEFIQKNTFIDLYFCG